MARRFVSRGLLSPNLVSEVKRVRAMEAASATEEQKPHLARLLHLDPWERQLLIGVGLPLGLFSGMGLVLLPIAYFVTRDRSFAWGWLISATILIVGIYLIEYRLFVGTEQLRAMIPLLEVGEAERQYALAITDPSATGATNDELLELLRRLVDEELRVRDLENALATTTSTAVADEVERLRLTVGTTRDEVAREGYALSLAAAERRLASRLTEDAARERVAAHREMIRQTALAAREAMRLSDRTTFSDGDIEGLRERVAAVGRDVAALEGAVREMRAL